MKIETNYPAPGGRGDQQTRAENPGEPMNPQLTIKHAASDKAAVALQDKLDRLLAKAKPTKRELILKSFRDLYLKLEEHLAQGRPIKDVLAAFNEVTQSKVCARTFNDMFEEERALRDRNGDPVCCRFCGHALHTAGREDPSPLEAHSNLSSIPNLIESE